MASLLVEPLGKPKSTGVGSLSILQRIFPTQESSWGLLHCRLLNEEFELKLIAVSAQDIVTMSGFDGEVDSEGFGDPNFD